MKAFNTITLTAVCLVSANTFAADNPRIYDKGLDMDTRFYSVACPDGQMGSVTVQYNINESDNQPSDEVLRARTGNARPTMPSIVEVCIYPVSDSDKICSARMDLQKAATTACK